MTDANGWNLAGVVGGVIAVLTFVAGVIDKVQTRRVAAEEKRRADFDAARKDETTVRRDEWREIVDRLEKDIERGDRKYTALEARLASCHDMLTACERDHAKATARIESLEMFCETKGFPVRPFVAEPGSKLHPVLPPPADKEDAR